MRLFILDPGLVGRVGHHYEFNRSLIHRCRNRSIDTALVGHASCDAAVAEELGVVRGFARLPYLSYNGPAELVGPLRWVQLSESIEQDLARLSFPAFGPADRLLMHTAHSGSINGLYRWYARLPKPRPAMCLQLMFPPSFQTAPEDVGVATALLVRALRPWTAVTDARIVIASDNRDLAAHLAALLDHAVATLPMPIDFPAETEAEVGAVAGCPVPRDGRLRLAYVGEGRMEKGFPRLVDTLFRHAGRLADTLVTLHTGTSGEGTGLGAALRALPHVDLIDRPLDPADYLAVLRRADAVLLPYDADAYAMRSSRVFGEALSLGKPVLVTAGTWMDRELARWGDAGVRMDPTAPDGLLDGIRALVAGLPALSAAARAAAPGYRRANSPDAFLDALSG